LSIVDVSELFVKGQQMANQGWAAQQPTYEDGVHFKLPIELKSA
jgi:hypothetical protein